jgi:hypothetical protein
MRGDWGARGVTLSCVVGGSWSVVGGPWFVVETPLAFVEDDFTGRDAGRQAQRSLSSDS